MTLRCSSVARDVGLDPLGTAGDHGGFLVVDWPLPWPADLADDAGLAPVHDALAGTGIRFQAMVPGPGDERRVVVYRRPPDDLGAGFAGYQRVERRASPDDVVDVAVDLLGAVDADDTDHMAGVGPAGPPSALTTGDGDAAVPGDLLVCTHGRRDACCGSHGTSLVLELLAAPAIAAGGYRVARTSHTGGHRFAPTAILLPEGTMWAFLDTELAARIVHRSGPVADVLGSYRGSTGIGSPAAQAVERVAFAEIGWDWLDWHRRGEHGDGGRVRVSGEAPDGTQGVWQARVENRARPVPDCGKPLDEARKQQHEPVVVTVTRTR